MKTKKLFATLLTLALAFGLFAGLPMSAWAANQTYVIHETSTPVTITAGIQNAINAAGSGNSVTVTGSRTLLPAEGKISLNIPSGVTVVWKAAYTGKYNYFNETMISLSGAGTFELASGGSIKKMDGVGYTLSVPGDGGKLKISGGTVSGNSTTAATIAAYGGTLEMTSGSVTNEGNGGIAIRMGPRASYFTVVNINGGTVRATGEEGIGIHLYEYSVPNRYALNISGGTVESTKYWAVYNQYKSAGITVTGGTIRANGVYGRAIRNSAEDAVITILGGTLECNDQGACIANATEGKNTAIRVSGGTLKATYSNSSVILSNGPNSSITVTGGKMESAFRGIYNVAPHTTIKISGGVISATTGTAVRNDDAASPITVNGGFLFAYGTSTVVNVLRTTGVATVAPPAVECAFNPPALAPTYEEGSSINLVVSPSGAVATWGKSGTQNGINYKSGAVSGFFPVSGVNVNAAPPAPSMSNFVKVATYFPGQFTDVNEYAWHGYYASGVIAQAFEYGQMVGIGGGKFGPGNSFTIAEAITVAAKIHVIYNTGEYNHFAVSSPWYKVFVDYALDTGIIGYGEFTNVTRKATRAEVAHILARALPPIEFPSLNTVISLPDVNTGTKYHDDIFMLYRAGVLVGTGSTGKFSPNDSITRDAVSAIAANVILPGERESGRVFNG